MFGKSLGSLLLAGVLVLIVVQAAWRRYAIAQETAKDISAAAARGVAYLAQETPAWNRDNHCYSCHNNADAARALLTAARGGWTVDPAALRDTEAFITDVARWDCNGGQGDFNDLELATLQFAGTLAGFRLAAREELATRIDPPNESRRVALQRLENAWEAAIDRVIKQQGQSGSWSVQGANPIGSPTTQAEALSTVLMRDLLQQAEPQSAAARTAAARADAWLAEQPPRNILQAAALLWSTARRGLLDSHPRRRESLAVLLDAQQASGGWGPHRQAPAEAFDTALAVWALSADVQAHSRDQQQRQQAIRRGREYLVRQQLGNGGWPATTRPRGGQSYAQHISTTSWALIALIDSGATP